MTQPPLSPETTTREVVLRLWAVGEFTAAEIARHCGVSRQRVRQILEAAGVAPRVTSQASIEQTVAMVDELQRANGEPPSIRLVASELGISVSAAHRRLLDAYAAKLLGMTPSGHYCIPTARRLA